MNNIDKSTKMILTVIAIALWIIALTPWLQTVPVSAAQDYTGIETYLSMITIDVTSMGNDVSGLRGDASSIDGQLSSIGSEVARIGSEVSRIRRSLR